MVNSLLLHPLTVEGGGEEYWDSLHVHNRVKEYIALLGWKCYETVGSGNEALEQ